MRQALALSVFFIASTLGAGATTAWAEERLVDLELSLAVDASGSVDGPEFLLQLRGIAGAFRDPEIIAAIANAPVGRIAVSLVMWADATLPNDQSRWFEVSDAASAEAFARMVEQKTRRVSGGTGIGKALVGAIDAMGRNGFAGVRQVVDVSGDGEETPPREAAPTIAEAKAFAQARGVTVNGLAILNDEPGLDAWYRRHVITGPGAFVMVAANYQDFAEAMRRKLLREIQTLPDVSQVPVRRIAQR